MALWDYLSRYEIGNNGGMKIQPVLIRSFFNLMHVTLKTLKLKIRNDNHNRRSGNSSVICSQSINFVITPFILPVIPILNGHYVGEVLGLPIITIFSNLLP